MAITIKYMLRPVTQKQRRLLTVKFLETGENRGGKFLKRMRNNG